MLWPLAWMGWLSLQRWTGYGPSSFDGVANFGGLLADPLFQTSLGHSLLWELCAAVLAPALGFGLALLGQRAKGPSIGLFFFPLLLPGTVVASIWTLVYSPLSGLVDGAIGMVGLPAVDWLGDPKLAGGALFAAWLWSALGASVLVCAVGLRSIDQEYLDLATVEGAGRRQRFRYVIFPGMRRALAFSSVISVALAWQVFDLVFATTGGGPGYATMLLPVDLYGRAFGGQTGEAAAEGALMALLGLALAAAALWFLRGSPSLDLGEHTRQERSAALPSWMMAAAAAIFILPLAWLARALFLPGRALALGNAGFDPAAVPANLRTVWSSGLPSAVGLSLEMGLAVATLTVALAIPAAFALSRIKTRIRWAALALLLVGLFQPTSVTIIPLFTLLKQFGLLDEPWGVLLPEAARVVPFATLLIWGYLAGSPREVFEAASSDGASAWQQLRYLAVPLAKPALLAAAAWAFITSWNEFLLPTLVSQDGGLQTVPTLLGSFVGAYDTQYGALAAGALIALLPPLLLLLLFRAVVSAGAR
ncbi:MAG: ABC transporter permease subunit [Chloroflexota bacterium]